MSPVKFTGTVVTQRFCTRLNTVVPWAAPGTSVTFASGTLNVMVVAPTGDERVCPTTLTVMAADGIDDESFMTAWNQLTAATEMLVTLQLEGVGHVSPTEIRT